MKCRLICIITVFLPTCIVPLSAFENDDETKLSLLVIDFSGRHSQGLSQRVSVAAQQTYPNAVIVNVPIKEGLSPKYKKTNDDQPYFELAPVSVRRPRIDLLQEQLTAKASEAAGGSGELVVHFDINEEGLPQQLREVFSFQLFGQDETRGPGLLGAALIKASGVNFAEVIVLRGHSDGTWCQGVMLGALRKAMVSPDLVILESPRERWSVWKKRFAEFPETRFISITASGDFPRDGLLDLGFGRADEVENHNYVNIDLGKWDRSAKTPHSATTAFALDLQRVRLRGWFGEQYVDFCAFDVVLGDLVKAVGSHPLSLSEFTRTLAGSTQTRVLWIRTSLENLENQVSEFVGEGFVIVYSVAEQKRESFGDDEVYMVVSPDGTTEHKSFRKAMRLARKQANSVITPRN